MLPTLENLILCALDLILGQVFVLVLGVIVVTDVFRLHLIQVMQRTCARQDIISSSALAQLSQKFAGGVVISTEPSFIVRN